MIEIDPLQALQERYGAEIDGAVSHLLTDNEDASQLYGMMRYQFGFADELLQPVAVHGGKRFVLHSACSPVRAPVAPGEKLLPQPRRSSCCITSP